MLHSKLSYSSVSPYTFWTFPLTLYEKILIENYIDCNRRFSGRCFFIKPRRRHPRCENRFTTNTASQFKPVERFLSTFIIMKNRFSRKSCSVRQPTAMPPIAVSYDGERSLRTRYGKNAEVLNGSLP